MYADGAMSEPIICIQTPPHCSEFVHEGDSLGSPSLYFASALISSFPVSSLPAKTLGLFPIGILAERAVIFLNLRSATCVWPACSCWHGDCYPRLLPIFSNQTSSSGHNSTSKPQQARGLAAAAGLACTQNHLLGSRRAVLTLDLWLCLKCRQSP